MPIDSLPISSDDLIARDPSSFAHMDAAALHAMRERLPHRLENIRPILEDGSLDVRRHDGDLVVDGTFENRHALVVDGHLTVRGDYHDDDASLLLVLGDLRVRHVSSRGSLAIAGRLDATGVVCAQGRYTLFAVQGPVAARAFVVADKPADSGDVTADVRLTWDRHDDASALRHFVPELVIGSLARASFDSPYASVDGSAVAGRIRTGLPLLRDAPAPASLLRDVARLLRSPTPGEIVALARADRLLAMLAAARAPPVPALCRRWIDDGDDALLALLVTNAGIDEATLRAIVGSTAVAARRAAAQHARLPADVLERCVADADVTLRTAIVRSAQVRRLSRAGLDALARDAEPAVRIALTLHEALLDLDHYAVLAGDSQSDVRAAAATALARQAVGLSFPSRDAAGRAALLARLGDDDDAGVRLAALPGLDAAAQERAVAAKPADRTRLLAAVADTTRSVALMRRCVDGDDALASAVARNLALPPVLQEELAAHADAGAIAILAGNPNAMPAALRTIAARGNAHACHALLDRTDLAPALYDAIAESGDDDLRDHWALGVTAGAYATRRQIERAEPATAALAHVADADWFTTLARSPDPRLRVIAAANAATPAEVLRLLLDDPEARVRNPVFANPSLPPDAFERGLREPEWLLANPAVPGAIVHRLLDASADKDSLRAERCLAVLAARIARNGWDAEPA